jgi:hypothetical protein
MLIRFVGSIGLPDWRMFQASSFDKGQSVTPQKASQISPE